MTNRLLRISAVLIGAMTLASCASMPLIGSLKGTDEDALSITQYADTANDKEFRKAWKRVAKRTSVQRIKDDTIRIEAKTPTFKGISAAETSFLARAAAETLKSNFDGFVIRYLDYRDKFPSNLIVGLPSFAETVEIGSYAEFLAYSKDQTLFASPVRKALKGLDGVIVMVNREDDLAGDFFPANELYESLLVRSDDKTSRKEATLKSAE